MLSLSVLVVAFAILGDICFTKDQDCIFTDSVTNEYKLDLSSLSGKEISYPLSGGETYNYTICANDLLCDQETLKRGDEAMVSIARYQNWGQPRCDGIGFFNETISPRYNNFGTSEFWEFGYEGLKCIEFNGKETVYYTLVIWSCNPNQQADIVEAQAFGTSACSFLVIIDSYFACTNNTNRFN